MKLIRLRIPRREISVENIHTTAEIQATIARGPTVILHGENRKRYKYM